MIGLLWKAIKPIAVQKAGQYAESKATEGDWDMSKIRDLKLNALTRAQRKERRAAGGAWWQKAARQERRSNVRDRFGNWTDAISGNASDSSAPLVLPPNLGANMPGPGTPGARNIGSGGASNGTAGGAGQSAYGEWYLNPLYLAGLAGLGFFLFRKKK